MGSPFKSFKELWDKFSPWLERKVPDARVSGDVNGRPWVLQTLDYQNTLKLEDLRKLTDRSELNKEFDTRYFDTTPSGGRGFGAIKIEVAALYSFNKCAVQRYKGRMHYYRDDLSQKRKRNTVSVASVAASLQEFSKNLS